MRVDFIRNFNATEDLVRNETFFCSKPINQVLLGRKQTVPRKLLNQNHDQRSGPGHKEDK